jgi:Ser/Thr protein kinase RdoA (MazF antagonist)
LLDPSLAGEVEREMDAALAEITRFGWEGLPRSVIHGDFNGGNLLFRNQKLTGVLDFDFAHPDLRVVDIAIAVNFTLALPTVVAGYNSVAKLCEEETRLIRPILRAFHLHHIGKYVSQGNYHSVGPALERVRFVY